MKFKLKKNNGKKFERSNNVDFCELLERTHLKGETLLTYNQWLPKKHKI